MDKKELDGVSILVAEDDTGIVTLLRSFFEQNGARVLVEKSGKNVLERVNTFHPDILILDVVMPYVDGLTALSLLRDSGDKTPAIMLTDKSTVDDKVTGLDCGADDYMTKPFSTKELLARIKTVLRRVAEAKEGVIEDKLCIGTLEINPSAREIHIVDGSLVQFTKTEFDLLYYLARKKTQVVSHGTLLHDVLGYKGDVETKALVMHIANMRKKMAKHLLTSVKIETVAGVGYKLIEA
ncbi:MAG: DNA-binding response OmpR family regulator [Desulforhopalus sp.]|jgi:DNA-binding response OmpR family regulator